MRYAESVLDLIGSTPLVRIRRLAPPHGAAVWAKREAHNPGGSVKDRAAYWMVRAAEEAGRLRPGGVIVEPTSGNTGIGIAMVAAVRGYRAIICLPGTASSERTAILRAYGAQVVLSPADEGMPGAIRVAEEILARTPGAVMLQQFENEANPRAHVATTGPEILADLGPDVARLRAFVATAGTGGTITGTGRFLKENVPGVRVVAVEPASSPVLSGGPPGHHRIPGMGPGFVPAILDRGLIDDIERVTDEEALDTARRLMREEGLLVGPSSGAAVAVAVRVAARLDAGEHVVTLLPDTGERYVSTEAFDPGR
ncbi:MAG: cysteine synthase A [Firmicutes bacterium]|nr:cysteine synthase A [Bacillota bacterium]